MPEDTEIHIGGMVCLGRLWVNRVVSYAGGAGPVAARAGGAAVPVADVRVQREVCAHECGLQGH